MNREAKKLSLVLKKNFHIDLYTFKMYLLERFLINLKRIIILFIYKKNISIIQKRKIGNKIKELEKRLLR